MTKGIAKCCKISLCSLSVDIPVIEDSWQSSFTVTYDPIPEEGETWVWSCKKEGSEDTPSFKSKLKKG